MNDKQTTELALTVMQILEDSESLVNNEFNELDYPTVTVLYAMDTFIREMYLAKPEFKKWVTMMREVDETMRDTSCIITSKDGKDDRL